MRRRMHTRSREPVGAASLPRAAAAPQRDAAAVEKETRAFPCGPALGPPGLRPQLSKDALRSIARQGE
eukprot:2790217-Alexandrium_andersonii.AAC.1